MPFTAPPSPDYSANDIVNPGTANEFAFYSTATEVDSTDKLIIRGDFQLGINVDLFAMGQTSFKTVEGSFQVLNDDETELRASLSLESQVLGGSLDLFNGSEEQVVKIHNDGSGNASIECKANKSIELGRSAGTPPLVVSDVVHLATLAAVAAGDVGMGADGRPMTFAASGFDERGIGIAAASRRVAAAKDVCDYLYDSGPQTISTTTLTVIATISGPASGKMYGIDAQLIGKFQDETSGEHLVRRIIAINNAGTITVVQGTNSGVSGTLGDAFGVQVNGANLEFYIDPGDATARDYRYIARVWELI